MMRVVLLLSGLDNIRREAVPGKVHQGVHGGDVLLDRVGPLSLAVHPNTRLDGDDQTDAEDHGDEGGGDVVDDGAQSHLARESDVHGA